MNIGNAPFSSNGDGIRAESTESEEEGRFTISLSMPEMKSNPSPDVGNREVPLRAFKIVVVDDNEAAADSLVKLLHLKGHTSEAAYTGSDALECVRTTNPDVVLLDIGLPDMSGYDVATEMREVGFTGSIIALSGYGQKEDMQKALDAGCDHHFTKPMAVTRLEEYLAGLR